MELEDEPDALAAAARLLRAARDLGIPAHGLDIPPRGGARDLALRDRVAAERIATQLLGPARSRRGVVVFGEAHLATPHLVSAVLAAAARLALLWMSGSLPTAHLGEEYLLLLPMLGLAEAFMNGLVMSVAVVYTPEWVRSFDDRLYLRR